MTRLPIPGALLYPDKVRTTFLFLFAAAALALTGCAGRQAQTKAERPVRKGARAAHPAATTGAEALEVAKRAVASCESATAARLARNDGGEPEPTGEDQCLFALVQSDVATSELPDNPEAPALFVKALGAAAHLPGAAPWLESKDKIEASCHKAAPFFLSRYRSDHRKDAAFELRCKSDAYEVYRTPVPGEQSLVGIFKGIDKGAVSHLMMRADDGRELDFWCLEGCRPFDTAADADLLGKKIRVYWIKEQRYVAEAGKKKNVLLFLRAELAQTSP